MFTHTYNDIISLENLLAAWEEFVRGKRKRWDVQEFQFRLFENIYILHLDLKNKTYTHGPYQAFNISDPKPRNIHKASVRDRLLHHAIYRVLYPYFDRKFIADSYSCRIGKGTHRAINRFRRFAWEVSKNNTRTVWVLKCDIRKFFASIDQEVLLQILREHIRDQNVLWLLKKVIGSFYSIQPEKGLPLGNLTSQLLVNIYMNEFDQWVKRELKAKCYIRYADDFVILLQERRELEALLSRIKTFLRKELRLALHQKKVSIKTIASSVDFLGWVHSPDHRVLRTVTKRRMLERISPKNVSSYLGLLGHGNGYILRRTITQKLKLP